MRNQVFISYSHRDKDWLERLQIHLKPLERKSNIAVWDDTRILSGARWRESIEDALSRARVAVLLVSPNFLASDFIANEELMTLLQAAEKDGLTILWVAVSASLYTETEIGSYQAVNNPSRPLDSLSPSELNMELVKIVERIKSAATIAEEFAVEDTPHPPERAANEGRSKKVALLYKRNAQPDEQLLKLLESRLGEDGYDVFIDRHMSIGVEWAREIEEQVRTADAVIPLISPYSIASEMIAYEIQIAHESAQQNQGKPRLLPIRVGYEAPLPEPLGSILNPVQYALWTGPGDDERLAGEVLAALRTPPPSKVKREKLEAVGGAVPLDSDFYVVRSTDEEFYTALDRRDSIVLVKGARQMGKTSLLARGLQQARAEGAKIVLTDFQKFNADDMAAVGNFFKALGDSFADQLDLDVFPEDVWNERRGPSLNFERYVRREALAKVDSPVVWAMDEVDRLFTCSYGSEVFGLFRSWHNERSLDPAGPWQRLTLAIAYATEAHLFITDMNQSPFNVGTRLTLEDFNTDQISWLNERYGSPLQGASQAARFYKLMGGHPILVRRGLNELASQGVTLEALEATADSDTGPLGDHLRRMLILLAKDPRLSEELRAVLKGQPCPTTEGFYRLRSAGVILGDSSQEARPRCELYAKYLKRHLL